MEAAIAEAAARGQVDLSLISVDSTTARAHHQAAGMVVDPELLQELEKIVEEEKGVHRRAPQVTSATADPTRTQTGLRPNAGT
ncbi:hypothetical protein AB0O28_03875 [Microbispora sp. NPDC088329]|uniref:hypothetical protein n=1 Tax=Microbispora sp. NPDC088329 TaxID=3154869 RepID=UPI00341DC136